MIQVTSKSPFERWLQYLGFPLALAVYGIIYSVPTPEALTVRGKLSLAVFFMALVLWVSEAIPTYATALLAIVMLALTGAWDEKSILGVFGYDVIWLMVAAFIITSGMVKTGVARRLALWLVATFGGTARRVLLIMIITNFILAFIVPSTTARAALILPIVVLLAQTYGAIPGKSNFGRALMIQELQVNNISTSAVLTATAPQIMAVGLIKDLTGQSVSWTSWLVASLPVALGTMIVSYLIGLLLFPPEVNTPKGEGIRKLKEELAALGRVTADEWKALAIFGLTIFLWATGPHHMAMFGFSISLVMVAIIAATLLYMPFIGLITWKETQIPWDLMIFSAGAYAVGLSIEKSGAASWALNEIFSAFNVTSIPFLVLFAVVMFIAVSATWSSPARRCGP